MAIETTPASGLSCITLAEEPKECNSALTVTLKLVHLVFQLRELITNNSMNFLELQLLKLVGVEKLLSEVVVRDR